MNMVYARAQFHFMVGQLELGNRLATPGRQLVADPRQNRTCHDRGFRAPEVAKAARAGFARTPQEKRRQQRRANQQTPVQGNPPIKAGQPAGKLFQASRRRSRRGDCDGPPGLSSDVATL
ncbi:MAG: hypothetical protein R3D43_09015 [Tepidamorphaceae bacterium]